TAPVLAAIADQSVTEGSLLTLTASATDADTPANALSYSLVPGAPVGAAIDATTGVFSWTPSEAQGPRDYSVTIRVTDEGTAAPELPAIAGQNVDEGALFTLAAGATDADLPANALSYSLDAGAPAGAAIVAATGVLTWTPTEAQGPGDYSVTVRVSDDGTPALQASRTFAIHVAEVNAAPELAPIADQNVGEGTLLQVAASATDADLPVNTLHYSLDAGAP